MWPSRAALVVDAFFDDTESELAMPDTGSAAEDFRLQLKALAKLLRGPRGRRLAALIVGSQTDDELRVALDERWVSPRQRWGFERLSRAIAEGQARADHAVFTSLDTLYSPLYAHMFLGLRVHSDAEIDALCDLVFPQIFRSDS